MAEFSSKESSAFILFVITPKHENEEKTDEFDSKTRKSSGFMSFCGENTKWPKMGLKWL